MRRKALTLVAAVLATSVALATSQAVKLEWKPKADAESNYTLKATAKIDFGGQPGDIEFSAKVNRKVKEVKSDSITIVEKQSDLQISMAGNPIDAGQSTSTTTSKLKPNGEVIESTSDAPTEAQSPRMEMAYAFHFPEKEVADNDTWTKKVEANSKKGTFTTEYKYTLVKTEEINGIKCYKITCEIKETDAPTNMTGTGTYWLRTDDCETVKATFKLSNVPLNEQIPPADLEATLELVK